jgi:chemotaxis protein MotB
MAMGGRNRTRRHLDIWAGYVDVLSTLLMVIIFTLMVFVIGQFFLSQVLSGRERKLAELSQQLSSLGDMLSLEKSANADLRSTLAQLTQQLAQASAARDKLKTELATTTAARDQLKAELGTTAADRDALAAALAQTKSAAAAAAAAKAEVDAKLADAYKTIQADQQKLQTLLGDIAVLESLRDELRQKLETSEVSNADLDKKLAASQGAGADLQAKLATAQQQIASLTQKLAANEGAVADLQAKLANAEQQIQALGQQLTAARTAGDSLRQQLDTSQTDKGSLQQQLDASKSANQNLQQQLAASQAAQQSLQQQLAAKATAGDQLQQQLTQSLAETDEQRRLRAESELQIEMLNAQLLSLRQQLARLVTALDASEAKAKADEVQVIDLGKRLNEALANKVEELARYRSEFFGKLREVLGNRSDIQIVGDRFIFQSEVLFDTGSAEIGAEGQKQLAAFADTLKTIAARIPPDINWVLRVDGHTDKRPYHGNYGTNWQLSTARAIAVVQFMIDQGIPANRLVAAGYAEFQPLDDGDTDDAYRRNRRIELKLDQR